ncbi:MAG: HdeD family acid-resistance protein [Planctomycetia bacterium]
MQPRSDLPADDLPALPRCALGLGAVLSLLGLLALAAPWAASAVIDYVCAGTLIAAGISQLGMTAATWTWRGFWLTLLCGVLSIVAGTAMLAIPVEGIHALVTFLGLVILFEAAAKLTAAWSAPPGFPWGWILFDGLVTALLGGILLTSPAAQAGIYLGVLIGINLLSSGISFLAAGFWLRRGLG